MLKECIDFEKDFNSDCKVYDCGAKDYFGNKFYIVTNEMLNQIRFMSKDKEYKKHRKALDDKNLQHVISYKWGNVINVDNETYEKIQSIFPEYTLPYRQNLEMLSYEY